MRVYSQDTGDAVLLWSARKDQVAAGAYADAFAAARTRSACRGTPQGQWVAIGVADQNHRPTRWDVFDPGCDRLVGHGGDAAVVLATVRPWAGDGIRAYVSASGLRAGVASYFRSPQG